MTEQNRKTSIRPSNRFASQRDYEKLYRALQVVENELGSISPAASSIRLHLAWLEYCSGQIEAAESHVQQVLQIEEQLHRPSSDVPILALLNISEAYLVQGQRDRALEAAARACAGTTDLPASDDFREYAGQQLKEVRSSDH